MKQLSKAGLSVLRVGVYEVHRIGIVYDLVLDGFLNEEDFNNLYNYLVSRYKYFPIQVRGFEPTIKLIPLKSKSPLRNKLVKITLFISTFITVWFTGYGITASFYELAGRVMSSWLIISWSFIYTILFLTAIGLHELGHIISSRKSGIVIDGPYFIPAPPIQLGFIGTLGAIINMKTLPPDRRSLARLGISGPLTGYVIGLLIGLIGVFLSPTISIDYVRQLIARGEVQEIGFLPISLMIMISLKPIPPNHTIIAHPLLFASFIVMLVTFLNLLPIGQLDGGHVVRSYVSMETYEYLGFIVIITMASAGLLTMFINFYASMYYFFLSMILVFFKMIFGRKPHPGPANQFSKIKDYRYLIIYLALLVLTLPVPII